MHQLNNEKGQQELIINEIKLQKHIYIKIYACI